MSLVERLLEATLNNVFSLIDLLDFVHMDQFLWWWKF